MLDLFKTAVLLWLVMWWKDSTKIFISSDLWPTCRQQQTPAGFLIRLFAGVEYKDRQINVTAGAAVSQQQPRRCWVKTQSCPWRLRVEAGFSLRAERQSPSWGLDLSLTSCWVKNRDFSTVEPANVLSLLCVLASLQLGLGLSNKRKRQKRFFDSIRFFELLL